MMAISPYWQNILSNPLFNIGAGIMAASAPGRSGVQSIGMGILQGQQAMRRQAEMERREQYQALREREFAAREAERQRKMAQLEQRRTAIEGAMHQPQTMPVMTGEVPMPDMSFMGADRPESALMPQVAPVIEEQQIPLTEQEKFENMQLRLLSQGVPAAALNVLESPMERARIQAEMDEANMPQPLKAGTDWYLYHPRTRQTELLVRGERDQRPGFSFDVDPKTGRVRFTQGQDLTTTKGRQDALRQELSIPEVQRMGTDLLRMVEEEPKRAGWIARARSSAAEGIGDFGKYVPLAADVAENIYIPGAQAYRSQAAMYMRRLAEEFGERGRHFTESDKKEFREEIVPAVRSGDPVRIREGIEATNALLEGNRRLARKILAGASPSVMEAKLRDLKPTWTWLGWDEVENKYFALNDEGRRVPIEAR